MSFKLTYATMFKPPENCTPLRGRHDPRARALWAAATPCHIAGEEPAPRGRCAPRRTPRDTQARARAVRRAGAEEADQALRAAHAAWPGLARHTAGERARLLRRVGQLIEERVYDIAAALTLEVGKNRMEALGEAQESGRFLLHLHVRIRARSKASIARCPMIR